MSPPRELPEPTADDCSWVLVGRGGIWGIAVDIVYSYMQVRRYASRIFSFLQTYQCLSSCNADEKRGTQQPICGLGCSCELRCDDNVGCFADFADNVESEDQVTGE